MNSQAALLVQQLDLTPQPERGYYRESYRAPLDIQSPMHAGMRSAFTSIHFLLADAQYSAWHRVASDETWFFHLGCELKIYSLLPTGQGHASVVETQTLGPESGRFEVTIPAGNWFAAKPVRDDGFSLVSCVVSPGFLFEDFELADQDKLLALGYGNTPDWPFLGSLLIR
jgi:predicted cupin superfamily sugar epimerase